MNLKPPLVADRQSPRQAPEGIAVRALGLEPLDYLPDPTDEGALVGLTNGDMYHCVGGEWRLIGDTAGLTDKIDQSHHGLTVGMPIRFDGTQWVPATADDAERTAAVGVVSKVVNTSQFVITYVGIVSDLPYTLVPGTVYYLSPTVAGEVVDVEPTGTGQYSKPILVALDLHRGIVLPHRWLPAGGTGGDGGTYTNPNPVPSTVGGISAGMTFPTPQTMQQMWDTLLYPYQAPGFGSFSFGQPGSVEVGYTMPAALTFTWSTSNSANVAPNTCSIVDNTAGGTLMAAAPNDGTQAIVLPGGSVQRVTSASYSFTISAVNTHGGAFSRSASISWMWRLHYGVSANPTLDSVGIGALANSGLASGYAGTYNMGAGGYKFISFAHAAGGQINSTKDTSTGFNVPFATAADNAAFSNVDGGGFSYALVSRTNANGVTTQYRLYRTKNFLGGAVTIQVT